MSDEGRPAWDQALADSLVGCEVIVGLTHEEATSTWQEQIIGHVEFVDRNDGVGIRVTGQRHNGELYWLPPDLRQFRKKAPPGEYRMRSTGEVVIDPDYDTAWIVNHPPASH